MKRVVDIENIAPIGDDGMWIATIGMPEHGECVTVIGTNLTQCVERTMVIVKALRVSEV